MGQGAKERGEVCSLGDLFFLPPPPASLSHSLSLSLFLPRSRDLQGNRIPPMYEGNERISREGWKRGGNSGTHGAATRRYSTSGGGIVDVDLLSQPASQPASANESC